MDFVKLLVHKKILPMGADDIVQAQRDPPDFGIGLKHVS